MKRDEIDSLISKIDNLVDEGKRPTESDDSVGIGTTTYDAAQQFSMMKWYGDTP